MFYRYVLQVCVKGVLVGDLVFTGVSVDVLVITGVCYRYVLQVCVTGASVGVLVLTGVSSQRVVGGASAGRSKALGCLSSHPRPTGALRWLNLCAKLCPYHPKQHDGGGLLASLLVGVGDLLGVGRQVGQTAYNAHTSLWFSGA